MRGRKFGHKVSIKTRRKISIAFTGRKLSEDHKEKIKLAMIGNKYGRYLKGKKKPPRTEEHKKHMSENHADFRGSKHPCWKGGISKIDNIIRNSPQYILWRKKVFIRDSFTCTICGKSGGKINAHHIKSFKTYPELRFEVSNGITMCIKCHYIGRKETPIFFL